jgi:small subunit ribosomal protein S8
MTMTDPLADMLTRLRNANTAFHDDVAMPSSNLKVAVAKILEREGYISGFSVEDVPGRPGKRLVVQMKYTNDRQRTISGLQRVSRPGLRVYSRARGVPRVLGGMGIAIVSTNEGLMTDREARERNVGGEILCRVW